MKRDESGFSLIEVIIGLVLLVVIGLAFYGGLTTALRTVFLTQERTTAESLARSQMEYIRDAEYDKGGNYAEISLPNYDVTVDCQNFSVNTTANVTDNLQLVSVTINHYGKEVITLEDFKAE